MNFFLLIVLEILFLIIAYRMFEKDVFSPAVITIFVILIGTIFVIPSISLWNVNICQNTLVVFFVGLLTCIFGSFVSKKIIFGNKHINFKAQKIHLLHFKRQTEIFISFLSLVLTLLYLLDAIRVGTYYGGHGFGAIAYMKNSYLLNLGPVSMNPFIRQGFKVVMALGYIASYALAKNIFSLNESFNKNLPYLVLFLCGCAITLFSGSRTEILRLVSALIICCSTCYRKKNGWNEASSKHSFFKTCVTFVPLLLVTIIVAFLFRQIVKVQGTGGSEISHIIDYASFYIGSPVQVLNIKLSNFSNFHDLFFGTNLNFTEFVYLGSLDYGGNVSTVFGTCILYNGILGMVLYLLIVYSLGTFLYYKCCIGGDKFKDCIKILCFAYIYCSFTMSYYSYCANLFFEISNILVLIVIVLLFTILYSFRAKIRRRNINERYHSSRWQWN